ALAHRQAIQRAVGRCRPGDGLAIAASDQVQPLADRRRAVVAGSDLAPLDRIAGIAKLRDPSPEAVAGTAGIRLAGRIKRPPGLELLDVLEADHARLHGPSPAHDDTRQRSPLVRALAIAEGLATPGLRMEGAVGRGP